MARVKRGTTAHARHKKITDKAKGYYGRRKNVFRVAVPVSYTHLTLPTSFLV